MTIEYKPGSEMLLADALSRCPARYSQEIKLDYACRLHSLHIGLDRDPKRDHLRGPGAVNCVSARAARMAKGEEESHHSNVAKYYWDFRDELSTDEGLLLKGLSLIIPAASKRELSSASTRRPPLSQQDDYQCKAAYVLAGDRC